MYVLHTTVHTVYIAKKTDLANPTLAGGPSRGGRVRVLLVRASTAAGRPRRGGWVRVLLMQTGVLAKG